MTKILVITGSARPNSVNKVVVKEVEKNLAKHEGVEVTIANLAELNLPFMDADRPPSNEGYEIPHESVRQWSSLVQEADGVVFVTPEYNHALSAIVKNAIDWLYNEWAGKPAAFVGYGWYSAANSHANFVTINTVIKLKLGDKYTGLQFNRDLTTDGTIASEANIHAELDATIGELLKNTGQNS